MVCVTNGSEDLEFVAIVDTLRRAPDIECMIAKVSTEQEKKTYGLSDLRNHTEVVLMHDIRVVNLIISPSNRLQIPSLKM